MKAARDRIVAYIRTHVPRAYRQMGGAFAHPFIDPGSIYNGNLWDWDSFWTSYALMVSETDTDKLLAAAKGGVLNFLSFQQEDGYIPMMVSQAGENGNYLIDKHQAGEILNMHKPFLCQQAQIISGFSGSHEWLRTKQAQLELYFDCYDRYYLHERTGLYVFADDVMIGMDNDPAVFGRPRFSTASMYLNGFMVCEMKAMARLLFALGDAPRAAHYRQRAKELSANITRECYDARDRFFYSVDVDIKTRPYDWFHVGLGVFWNSLPIKIRTWTGFIPLYAGIASEDQARDIVRLHIEDAATFASPYGIRTLARDEKMYNLEATNNPSNWLGGIWVVASYVVFRGLVNYGYRAEAERLCEQTVKLLDQDLQRTGDLHEYYVPETGSPVMNPGFLNWNMLAVNMVSELETGQSVFDYLRYNED